MPAYLKFFELDNSPFEGTTQTKVVLGTKALRAAFAAIREGLDEGAARICVSGGRGLGKTSLAKALPKLLGESARVALALDPGGSWESLRGAIARQWGLESEGILRGPP
jgi:MSHA biogenesis protein MshM